MPEDTETSELDVEEPLTPIVHDDIMKRLLDYQRRLRGDEAAEMAPAMIDDAVAAQDMPVTEGVVDLTGADADHVVVEITEPVEAEAAQEAGDATDTAEADATASRRRGRSSEATEAQTAELTARVEALEATLDRIGTMLAGVRKDFQDLTIRADERIAEIEQALAAAKTPSS